MSQLHLDYAGELSVCDKSGLIKQEICLRASSLLSASVLYICCSCSHLPRRHLGRAASCLFRWYQRPAAMSSSCNHTFHHVRDGWTDLRQERLCSCSHGMKQFQNENFTEARIRFGIRNYVDIRTFSTQLIQLVLASLNRYLKVFTLLVWCLM